MDREREQALERRIDEKARRIRAEQGGGPERDAEIRAMAAELVAQEDNLRGTLKANPSHGPDDEAAHQQPVEPLLSAETLGDMPGLTDQGEGQQVPSRRRD